MNKLRFSRILVLVLGLFFTRTLSEATCDPGYEMVETKIESFAELRSCSG